MSMILNPYRYAREGGPTFGNASREFDGNDRVATGDWFDLSNSDFSVAAWINIDTIAKNTCSIFGLSQGVVTKPYWILIHRVADGGVTWQTDTGAGADAVISDAGAITANAWHHVALVRDQGNGRVRIYIDGTEEVNQILNPNFDSDHVNGSFQIGSWSTSAGNYFEGNISDARVYDRVITAGEVSNIYAGTNVLSGLVGWWLTDNDDVLDYAGSNDGSNDGSTYSTDGPFG